MAGRQEPPKPASTTIPPPPSATLAPPLRTPAEQEVLDYMVRCRGQAYVDQWAELILAQARMIGEV
jgi:hypothetical protein